MSKAHRPMAQSGSLLALRALLLLCIAASCSPHGWFSTPARAPGSGGPTAATRASRLSPLMLRLRGGKRSGMYPARQSKRLSAEREARSSTPSLAHALSKRRKGGPGAAAASMARAEAEVSLDDGDGGYMYPDLSDYHEDGNVAEGLQAGVWGDGGLADMGDDDDGRGRAGVGRWERTGGDARGVGRAGAAAEEEDSWEEEEEGGEEKEGEGDREEEDEEEGGVEELREPLPQRRLRPYERDSEMEEPLEAVEDPFDNLKHVRAINFTFNVDEVAEQIKVIFFCFLR